MKKLSKLLVLPAILLMFAVVPILTACGGNNDNNGGDPAPTVTLSPSSVSIGDSTLTATSTVGGTATGDVTLNTSNLPTGVSASVNSATITVTGIRQAAVINGTFTVGVTRGGITQNLSVVVSLTATEPPADTVILTPSSVTINDANLTRTVQVSGTASGAVALDITGLPVYGVMAIVSDTTITVIGTRQAIAINNTFTVGVSRGGITQNLTIVTDLSPTGTGSDTADFDTTPQLTAGQTMEVTAPLAGTWHQFITSGWNSNYATSFVIQNISPFISSNANNAIIEIFNADDLVTPIYNQTFDTFGSDPASYIVDIFTTAPRVFVKVSSTSHTPTIVTVRPTVIPMLQLGQEIDIEPSGNPLRAIVIPQDAIIEITGVYAGAAGLGFEFATNREAQPTAIIFASVNGSEPHMAFVPAGMYFVRTTNLHAGTFRIAFNNVSSTSTLLPDRDVESAPINYTPFGHSWFRFTLDSAQNTRVMITQGGHYTIGAVVDGEGRIVEWTDHGGYSPVLNLDAGTYYIFIRYLPAMDGNTITVKFGD
jgi:hypothetical protein